MTGAAGYSFGNDSTAADRLLVVARVFDPLMAALLAELPDRRWRCVVDLGCGPGSSTERLLPRLRADRVIGVDASASFCALAARRVPGATFVAADVTAPLPVAAPDLIYARCLLAHLPDPARVAAGWSAQLAPDGFALLEEPEAIDTDDPVCARYLELTAGAVAARGATMFVGGALAALGGRVNRAVPHDVTAVDAATMFALNLRTLRHDPWVTAHADASGLDTLARELERRRSGEVTAPALRWHVRQVVLDAP